MTIRTLSPSTEAAHWIEYHCRRASGELVHLSREQRAVIQQIYDYVGSPPSPPDRELMACLSLLHLCGPQKFRPSKLTAVPADVFAIARQNVELSEELKAGLVVSDRKITCPELGTILPLAA